MKRATALAVMLTLTVAFPIWSALADSVYHSEHVTLAPVGDASLRTGFVENVHANGPRIFATERYVLNGATPNTMFDVVLHIWVGDTTCSGPETAAKPTASSVPTTSGTGSDE